MSAVTAGTAFAVGAERPAPEATLRAGDDHDLHAR